MERLKLTFSGTVIGPKFSADIDQLDFGVVSYSFLNTRTFNLTNFSEIPMRFALRVNEGLIMMMFMMIALSCISFLSPSIFGSPICDFFVLVLLFVVSSHVGLVSSGFSYRIFPDRWLPRSPFFFLIFSLSYTSFCSSLFTLLFFRWSVHSSRVQHPASIRSSSSQFFSSRQS